MNELLYLVHRIPYPPNKGDKIRSFNLLRHLARHYRVHLGTFIDDPDDWRHVPALKEMCGETCFVGLNSTSAKLRSLSRLIGREPMTLSYYRNARLKTWVDQILARGTVRRVLVFSSAMAPYVKNVDRDIRRVIDFVDVDSEKWRQYSQHHPWPVSWLYRREGRNLLKYEREQALDFDMSVFVTKSEADLFMRYVPEAAGRVSFIENGVDADYFSPEREYPNPYPSERRILVFTGAMDYRANVDAVDWFARNVFPQVRSREPGALFYIVGARPTKAVMKLGNQAGVRVTGAVADIRPYLAHAHAAVAPLRIARGMQNKVLEAMSMARPVLATPAAMDGVHHCPGLESLVAETPEAMAARAVELLSRDDLDALGRRGRECVLQRYNWGKNLHCFELLLEGGTTAAQLSGVGRGEKILNHGRVRS